MRGNIEATKSEPVDLVEAVEQFIDDPLGFVYFVFPWGEGALAGEDGPDKWQAEVLQAIGDRSLNLSDALQIAVRSGHGVGKGALCAWVILWFMSTRPHPEIVVTANTQTQLLGKTWRELAKWHKLAINRDWFEWTKTQFHLVEHPETWFAHAIPWSKQRSEAFAGTHERYVLMIFDEASAIDDDIWEVAEGAMTTPGAIWIVFGNPTRNSGRFRECWGKFRHRWLTWKVDARTAKKANEIQINKWIEDYGEDSDFVRIRVTGEFPKASWNQFISDELIAEAQKREPVFEAYRHAPIVIGVDVARFGDDRSVILVRQGSLIHKIRKIADKDTMQLTGYITEEIDMFNPVTTFVDVVGIGAGVCDRLRQLGYKIVEVNTGIPALDEKQYRNLRAEIWNKMREWLKVGCLPDDGELKEDLAAPEYGFDVKNRIQIESKEDMKARGLASPDIADALAMTFTTRVRAVDLTGKPQKEEYNPLTYGLS